MRGKLPKLSIALIRANSRYFCDQGFEPRETLSQVKDWLEGGDDPEIQAKVIKWMESDIKWTQEIWAEVAHYYWYLWPVVWFVSHHIAGRAKRWVEILKKDMGG